MRLSRRDEKHYPMWAVWYPIDLDRVENVYKEVEKG